MHKAWCACLALLILLPMMAAAQSRTADFPFGARSTASPDGRFELTNRGCETTPKGKKTVSVGDCDRRLWLVDRQTKNRVLLMEIERNVRVGWAPGGNLFFLNDNSGSNIADAYLQFPAENRRVNLGELIDREYPKDRKFEGGHHYFNVERWIDSETLMVKRFGHTDQGTDASAFTVCYRVTTAGKVTRLIETHNEESSCPKVK